MQRLGVMHIIDTLSAAGAERVAVNMVNHLPRQKYVPYLCTTRCDGPLDVLVRADVGRVRLKRKSRRDLAAIARLRRFIRSNKIGILHAHGPSLMIARLAAIGTDAKILWHAHHGRYALEDRRALHYRMATDGIAGVITVNRELAEWCARRLTVPSRAIWYLPNPVSLEGSSDAPADLPGTKGSRIICVANFRVEKDHLTLVRAIAQVARKFPAVHLLLVGSISDASYKQSVEKEILALGLQNHISLLGARNDIPALLRQSDIGVLSSASEGLPMSLLEYGAAGLPVVATNVGECSNVLDHGLAGLLVPPGSPDNFAGALTGLLASPERRNELGARFRRRVNDSFSADAAMKQLCDIYDSALGQPLSPRHLKRGLTAESAANTTPKTEIVHQ
jgi:glycosyltransferase involved in cell wall biosynthesis